MTHQIAREGIRFLASGAVNTALTYALYLLLLQSLDYLPAYTIAYIAGIVLAYFLSVRYVFRTARNWRTMAAFPLIYAVQYTLGAAVLHLAVASLGLPREFALLASIAVTVPVTFLLSRQLFKSRRSAPAETGKKPDR